MKFIISAAVKVTTKSAVGVPISAAATVNVSPITYPVPAVLTCTPTVSISKSLATNVNVAAVEFATFAEPSVISKFPVAPVNPAEIKSAAVIVITSPSA